MEPEYSPRREYLLTASGSEEVNGSYTVSSENDLFYKKRHSVCDSSSVVYIITLDSLPDLGENFEIAWVLQSHDAVSDEAVTFYATPCEDPDSVAFPLKGWIAVSGLEPVPRMFPRPMQHPRGRSSTLDIIEEDEEVDFSIEPFWAHDEDNDESNEEWRGTFADWDEYAGDDLDEEWNENYSEEPSSEGEESDYGEIELPDDIMENFEEGQFVHKQRPQDSSANDQRTRSPRGASNEVDSDTSEDYTEIRHDTSRNSIVDHGELPGMLSLPSQPDEKEMDEEKQIVFPAQRRESGVCSDNLDKEEEDTTASATTTNNTVDLMNPHLAHARSLGVKGEITMVDLRNDTPTITGARVGSRILRHSRRSSGRQDELDVRIVSPPYRPLIAPPKDPFIPAITVHSRSRTSRDHMDVDLISSVVPEKPAKTPRRKSARLIPGGNELPRRKTREKRGKKRTQNVEETPAKGVQEKEAKRDNEVPAIESVSQSIPSEEVKRKAQPTSHNVERKRDPEREKLEEEMHQLKTKMRKCDRLSKLRKRGRNLTKEQQDSLVHKSKYQRRIEELRRLLGSDIGR